MLCGVYAYVVNVLILKGLLRDFLESEQSIETVIRLGNSNERRHLKVESYSSEQYVQSITIKRISETKLKFQGYIEMLQEF